MSDYHVHLHPHQPWEGGPAPGEYPDGHIASFVEVAATRGISEVGFTEHLYRCVEAAPVLGAFWEGETAPGVVEDTVRFFAADLNLSLEGYVAAVVAAKEEGLPVKLGLEVDFFPETMDAVMDLIAPYPWDYLMGSVHWIGGWAIDAPLQAHEFERRGIDIAWEQYFELEAMLAGRGDIDVLAHVDLCKKYGYRPAEEPLDLYARVVEAAAASGTAVEVSSQGLRKPAAEVYPSPRLLGMFREAGVAITLASDAHLPEETGWGTDDVREAAVAAGYDTYLRFDRRRRAPTPLER